jgi:hypothetical protein
MTSMACLSLTVSQDSCAFASPPVDDCKQTDGAGRDRQPHAGRTQQMLDGGPQEVACEDGPGAPHDGPGHVVGEERPVRHAHRAGGERRQGPQEPNEPGEEDRCPAAAVEEQSHAGHPAAGPHLAEPPVVSTAAEVASERVADAVAEDRACDHRRQEPEEVEASTRGEGPRHKHESLSGQGQPQKSARLAGCDAEQAEISERPRRREQATHEPDNVAGRKTRSTVDRAECSTKRGADVTDTGRTPAGTSPSKSRGGPRSTMALRGLP